MPYLWSSIIGYLLGSVNFAIILSRLAYRRDIREQGSKNAGMTNMLRVYGWKAALPVFIGDFAKSAGAVYLCRALFPAVPEAPYLAAFFAVAGHLWPVYFGFRGGKGIAATAGIIFALDPIVLALVLVPWFVLFFATRTVSVASLAAAAAYPVCTAVVLAVRGQPWLEKSLFALGLALLLFYMHRSNIRRLRDGTENRFGPGKKDPPEKPGPAGAPQG